MGVKMDNFRYRHGDARPRMFDVEEDTVVRTGDLVFQADSGYGEGTIFPAGQDSDGDGEGDLWSTNIAGTQEEFHDVFAGVAAGRSLAGETEPVRVNTSGVHEFDCAAATFEIGDLVGPAKTSGDNIENQKVVAVATANLAIGRVAQRYASNTTRVKVEIVSTVQRGGPQTMA